MNPIHTLRRAAGILAGLASAALASMAAAPAALAGPAPHHSARPSVQFPPVLPAGWYKHPSLPLPAPVHTAVTGGMPGWQITLIAVGAVLVGAVMLLARARTARRRAAASPA